MKVKATKPGYFNNRLIQVGQVFSIPDSISSKRGRPKKNKDKNLPDAFSSTWMEIVDEKELSELENTSLQIVLKGILSEKKIPDRGLSGPLLKGVTSAPFTSEVNSPIGETISFHAWGATETGTGSATIKIYGSLDDEKSKWVRLATITLSLSVSPSIDDTEDDGITLTSKYKYLMAKLTAISGDSAKVYLYYGL